MSVEEMGAAWRDLRPLLDELHDRLEPSLRAREPFHLGLFRDLETLLDNTLMASERIRDAAIGPLANARGPDYERVSQLLLAVAAVDAMVACELALVDPYGKVDLAAELANEQQIVTLDGERKRTLDEADALFAGEADGALGASPGGAAAQALLATVGDATVDLTGYASAPAKRLLGGLAGAGIGDLLGLVGAGVHVDLIAKLEHVANTVKRHAPRFLRAHVSKIVALGADSAEGIEEGVMDQTGDFLARRVGVSAILGKVADVDAAERRTSTCINKATTLNATTAGDLQSALMTLGSDYRKQMDCVDSSAKWLRRGGSALSHLISLALPGAGVGILCGVYFVGVCYVAYSFTDRIDARDLGFADRVEGVVKLVEWRVH